MAEKIYTAINAVMEEVGAIGKEKKNQQQGFLYRGIDDVMNALQPAMTKHKIFVMPEVLEQTREIRKTSKGGELLYSILKVKYTFYTDDGSHVECTVIGEGMDSGDKASNKALSVAFKYACFQVFCIPTEELKDPDAQTPPSSQTKPKIPPNDMTQDTYDNMISFLKQDAQRKKLSIKDAWIMAYGIVGKNNLADFTEEDGQKICSILLGDLEQQEPDAS